MIAALGDRRLTVIPGERIAGLDAWRGILILVGLFLHATWAQPERPLFVAIALVSASFRMGAFFAISGFLCGLAIIQRPDGWLTRRLFQLALPTAFALAVICPAITALLKLAEPGSMTAAFNWYHIWFLVALLFYTPLGYALHILDRRHGLFDRFDRHAGAVRVQTIMLGVAFLSFTAMIAAVWAMLYVLPEHQIAPLQECRLILGYAPLYLLGFVLGRSPALLAVAVAGWRAPAVLLAFVFLSYAIWFGAFGHAANPAIEALLMVCGQAIAPPAATLLILRSAMALRRIPPALARLNDAAFTIYLIHVPLLIATNIALRPVAMNIYAGYALAIIVGGGLSYLLHRWVIRRSPLLLLLFNGQSMQSRSPPSPAVAPITL